MLPFHQRTTPQNSCVDQHQARAQPPPSETGKITALPAPPGAWTWLPGASRAEKTSVCHTFRELIQGGAVHKVAERVCYRGLLPVPEEEKGALDHSGNVSETQVSSWPSPRILHTELLVTSLDPGFLTPGTCCCLCLEPSLLPPLLLVILHKPALASPPPGRFPSPPAEPPEPLELPYITLGCYCVCLSSHQAG